MRGRGRPIEDAPDGMVTIRQARELTGLGYGAIYRRVAANTVRYTQSDNLAVYIDIRDLPLLMEKPPKNKRQLIQPVSQETGIDQEKDK